MKKEFKGVSGLEWRPRLEIFKGSNGKVEFNPETFQGRSYNWWIFVAKIKGKVSFNDYRYSVTTNQHQRTMEEFLATNKIKVDVTVKTRKSLGSIEQLNDALAEKYESLIQRQIKFERANKKNETDHLKAIKNINKEIKILKSLGAKFSKDKVTQLTKDILADDAARLERQRAKSREYREIRKSLMKEVKDTDAISFNNGENV